YVCCREPEQAYPLIEQEVLPAIVLDQVVAMPIAVILDGESRLLVPDVDAADPGAASITDPPLDAGPRASTLEQDHSQHRLHQRLGRRFCQLHDLARLGDALPASPSAHVFVKLGPPDESAVQERVYSGHRLHEREVTRQIEASTPRMW